MPPTAVLKSTSHLLYNEEQLKGVSMPGDKTSSTDPDLSPVAPLNDVPLSHGSSVLHPPLLGVAADTTDSASDSVGDTNALYLYTVTSGQVRVYSAASSRLLHVLRAQSVEGGGGEEEARGSVVAASVDPRRPGHVVILQSDGLLIRWHAPLAVCLQRYCLYDSLLDWRQSSKSGPAKLGGTSDGTKHPKTASGADDSGGKHTDSAEWLKSFVYVTTSGQTYMIVSKQADHSSPAYLVRINLPAFGSEPGSSDSQLHHVSMVVRNVASRGVMASAKAGESNSEERRWLVAFSGGSEDSLVAAVAHGYRGSRREVPVPGAGAGVVVAPLRSGHGSPGSGKAGGLQVLYSGSLSRVFVSVACRASSQSRSAVVVAGDSTGCIHCWRNLLLLPSAQKPLYTTLHWHSTPVVALTFGASQLYSGGGESVLCVWSMNKEGDRPTFLPRLGMPLLHISSVRCVDSSGNTPVLTNVFNTSPSSPASHYIAVAQSDNTIRLVDVLQRRLVPNTGSSAELALSTRLQRSPQGGATALLLRDPISSALVLNASDGHLQFFSSASGRQLYSLDITRTNYISGDTQQRTPIVCDVTHAVFTHGADSQWMVTVEGPVEGHMDGSSDLLGEQCDTEYVLKFWQWDSPTQQYVVNTCVHEPHDSAVLDLVASQSGRGETALVVSVAHEDRWLKLWTVASQEAGELSWWLASTLSHRALTVKCVAVSLDGVFVAAAFSNGTTVVWRVECTSGGTVQCTRTAVLRLYSDRVPDDVEQVVFVSGGLLACRMCGGRVYVWDLQQQVVVSCVSETATLLAAGHSHSWPYRLAVFERDTDTATITAHVWDLRHMRRTHISAASLVNTRRVLAALLDANVAIGGGDATASNDDAPRVVYLTDQMCLRALVCSQTERGGVGESADESHSSLGCHDNGMTAKTPFAALITRQGHSVQPSVEVEQSSLSIAGVARSVEETLCALDGPSHTVTNLTRLCDQLVSTLLPQLQNSTTDGSDGVRDNSGGGDVGDCGGVNGDSADGEHLVQKRCPNLDELIRIDFSFLSNR